MKRLETTPRENWKQRIESQGLTFHTRDAPYWTDSTAYEFTVREIDTLEKAANDVHELCLEAAQQIIDHDWFDRLGIPPVAAQLITDSWNRDELHLYGRFDFLYDGNGQPKLLEYNADTPTSLLEAAVIQWHWLKDKFPKMDQFNSLHEKLIERWKQLNVVGEVHLAAQGEVEEDRMTVEYLRDTALQAGLQAHYLNMEDIGYDTKRNRFVDLESKEISTLFKLYPWEWMIKEEFGQHLTASKTRFIEPAWKMLWSNKGILPILWELAPEHPNLLYATTSPQLLNPKQSHVRKPLLGREGANVAIRREGGNLAESDGLYGEEGFVYQSFYPINPFQGKFPVLGLWMVGDYCCGMGIRESDGMITDNLSRFVPHYFK